VLLRSEKRIAILLMMCCFLNILFDNASVAGGNVVLPRRPVTAMDNVIKENVVQPPVIRPKPLPVTGAAAASDQVFTAFY